MATDSGRKTTREQTPDSGAGSSPQGIASHALPPRSSVAYLSFTILAAAAAIALALEPVPLDSVQDTAATEARWTVVDSAAGAVQVKMLPVTLRASEMVQVDAPAVRQPLSATCPDLAVPSAKEPALRHARPAAGPAVSTPARAIPARYTGHPTHANR